MESGMYHQYSEECQNVVHQKDISTKVKQIQNYIYLIDPCQNKLDDISPPNRRIQGVRAIKESMSNISIMIEIGEKQAPS